MPTVTAKKVTRHAAAMRERRCGFLLDRVKNSFMIDTHCHLTDPRIFSQLDNVLRRAVDANVVRMITIGTSVAESRAALGLARAHENVRCTVGIHPNNAVRALINDIGDIRSLASNAQVLALGEMGLDYHYDVDRAVQKSIFEQQLELAAELKMPIVIHCREAIDDCLDMMKGVRRDRAIFHCFTGSPRDAQKIIDAGFWIGFTGALTFKKNDDLREAARLVPRELLLVETDSPYLSPEPMRKQKTNEPSLVVHVADMIASLWGTDRSEVDRVTTANAERFFQWT